MTDITFFASHQSAGSPATSAKTRILSSVAAARELLRLWYHNYRTRRELAAMAFVERADLGYRSDIDAEIGKPFWNA